MKRFLAFIAALAYSLAAHAQIATIDSANVVQSTISAQQAVTQTSQQLQQLQNMIQNTKNPSSFQWDNPSATINGVLAGVNTLNTFQGQTGGIAAYLSKYSDASQYQNGCIGTGGCTTAQLQQISASQYTGSDSQKTANDNMLLNLNAQQQLLQNDATDISVLQQHAQGSLGQMEALQAGNQLASNQAVQLMQIRSLMLTQQAAEATRAETVADREAQEQAASDAFINTPPAASTSYNVLNYAGLSR